MEHAVLGAAGEEDDDILGLLKVARLVEQAKRFRTGDSLIIGEAAMISAIRALNRESHNEIVASNLHKVYVKAATREEVAAATTPPIHPHCPH